MKWIYYFKKKWLDTDHSPLQAVYVRPTMPDEEGNQLVGKIIDLNVIATEYFMRDEFKSVRGETGLDEIYFTKLDARDYYILEEAENPQPDLFLQAATLYIKDAAVTPDSMLAWIKVYLDVHGFPHSELQETDFNDFVDTNPLYTMLTEGARKMEGLWGKEWWKTDDQKE